MESAALFAAMLLLCPEFSLQGGKNLFIIHNLACTGAGNWSGFCNYPKHEGAACTGWKWAAPDRLFQMLASGKQGRVLFCSFWLAGLHQLHC